jgi:uncharacterized protein (DUF1697 family)
MTRYVAFLRAVNIGGRVVKMEDLRKMFDIPGFKNITTYIQTGNVIFDTAETDKLVLIQKIETKLLKALGYEVKTILKTIPEIATVVKKNPFPNHADDMNLYVSFLLDKPTTEAITALSALQTDNEQLQVINTEVYLLCRKGTYGNSVFSNNFFEKKLKTPATTRNWATVNKMLEY